MAGDAKHTTRQGALDKTGVDKLRGVGPLLAGKTP